MHSARSSSPLSMNSLLVVLLIATARGNEIQTIREYVNYDISIRPNGQGDYVPDIEASGTVDTDTHKMKPATEIKPVPTAIYQPMPHLSWMTTKPTKAATRLKRQPNIDEQGDGEGPNKEETSGPEQSAVHPATSSPLSKEAESSASAASLPAAMKERESKPMMKGANSTGQTQQGDASYYHPHHHYGHHDHHHPYPHEPHHHHHEEHHHMHDDHHHYPHPHHHHHHEHPHHHPHHHHHEYEDHHHHPIVIVKDHHHHHHDPEVIVVKEKHVHHFHHKPYY